MVPLTAVNLAISFAAGFLTFFAGCLVPVVPAYLAYLAASPGQPFGKNNQRRFIGGAFLFSSGFTLAFITLGLTVNSLARVLAGYRPVLEMIVGVFLVLFGIHFTALWPMPILNRSHPTRRGEPGGVGKGAFLLGLGFGFSWTPCIGPVLAAILFWVGSYPSFYPGLLLLLAFSLGLALPFLLIGLSFDRFYPVFRRVNHLATGLNRFAGALLIIIGLLVLTRKFSLIYSFFLKKFGSAVYILELRQ